MILLQSLYPDKRPQITITRKAVEDMAAAKMAAFISVASWWSRWMTGIAMEEDEIRSQIL